MSGKAAKERWHNGKFRNSGIGARAEVREVLQEAAGTRPASGMITAVLGWWGGGWVWFHSNILKFVSLEEKNVKSQNNFVCTGII